MKSPLTNTHSRTSASHPLQAAVTDIESAIVHVNNAAQAEVSLVIGFGQTAALRELRLIVRALADIRERLREMGDEDGAANDLTVTDTLVH